MQRKGYWLGGVLDWVLEKGTKYAPLLKTGVAALSTYGAWKDQQKKNEMQQGAYDDYMRQAAAAGHEAQAAVDINLTPMTVSGVPTTKADVTDFTPVAKGGLMTLPNKQRKRYARGPNEFEVETMDEETITPFDLQMEEGVNIGEQVKYETGNPREGAWSVWNSGGINQEIYDFDFEIFFDSGDWSDHLRGQVDVEGDMQMASSDMGDPMDNADEHSKRMFNGKKYNELTPKEIDIFDEEMIRLQNKFMAAGGIAGLRHGGRPGYNIGEIVTADTEGVVSEVSPSRKTQIEGNQMSEDAYNEIFQKFIEKFPGIATGEETLAEMIAMLQAEGVMETEDLGILGLDRSMDMITPQSAEKSAQRISMGDTQYGDFSMAQGGRIGYRLGDQVGITSLPRPAMDPRGFRSLPAMATKDGMMDLGGLEKDYRWDGGFVPIGEYEKKDDVPARLSKNEFVMTADAVRAAGGGSINKGAQRMYDTMKHLEASPQAKRMTA